MISNLAAGLVVQVKDKATRVLGMIGKGFQKLKAKGRQLATGLGQIGRGFVTLSTGAVALAGALGFMAFKAASFEEQMSAVKSIMMDVTDAEFSMLEKEIKRLGATTKFSATEAAKGAELLARAGFDAAEQVAALNGVLNAAAAESIDMATSANIISNAVRAFGLEASEAVDVADVLAVTSAKTNTSMIQLGEGMKMVSSTARQMGQKIGDTSAALGMLANAGLQGSLGGTALNTMMLRMAKLSDENKKKFNDLGIQIQDVHGNMLPLPEVMKNMAGGFDKLGGNMEEAGFLMDAFGIRGQKSASILAAGFTDMNKVTADGTNKFEELMHAVNNAGDAAQNMADERMKNLRGSITLLNSAIEGLSIELMTPIVKELSENIKGMADAVNEFQASEFGIGFLKSAEDISAGIKYVVQAKNDLMAMAGGAGANTKAMGRMAGIAMFATAGLGVLAVAAGVVLVPLLGALWMSIEGVAAAFGAVAAALPPVLVLFALATAFISATQQEGQSFGERFIEIVTKVWNTTSAFFRGFQEGYQTMMEPAFDAIFENLNEIWVAFKPVFVALNEAFGGTAEEAASMGEMIGTVFGFLANALTLPVYILTDLLGPAIGFVVRNFIVPMIESIGMVGTAFKGLLSGTKSFAQSFKTIMKGVAGVLMNTIFLPFKMAVLAIMEAAAAIGAVSNAKLGAVKGFFNMEAGSYLGRPANDAQSAASKATAEAHAAKKNALETGYRDREQSMTGNLETTVKGCINNNVKIAGKNLSIAKSEHEFELSQRGGFSLNPFQQGPIIANGGLPAGGTG